jgi:hypothetical protein
MDEGSYAQSESGIKGYQILLTGIEETSDEKKEPRPFEVKAAASGLDRMYPILLNAE